MSTLFNEYSNNEICKNVTIVTEGRDLRVQIKVNPLGAVEWSVRVGGFPDVHSVWEVVLLAPLQHLRAGERSVNLLVLRLPLVLPHHLTGRSDQNFWETAKGMECTMQHIMNKTKEIYLIQCILLLQSILVKKKHQIDNCILAKDTSNIISFLK